jgi:hypothetical protein
MIGTGCARSILSSTIFRGERQWQHAYAAGATLTGDRAIEIALQTLPVHAVA